MTSTQFLPHITPASIGWPEATPLPQVEHAPNTWCDHSVCEAFADIDGAVTSIKTRQIFDVPDGERVEVERVDTWNGNSWIIGDTKIVGLTPAVLLEHGTAIVVAALRAGFDLGDAR